MAHSFHSSDEYGLQLPAKENNELFESRASEVADNLPESGKESLRANTTTVNNPSKHIGTEVAGVQLDELALVIIS
ncbi:hypothetical protein YALI2_A00180g [Yarrowia lipolytica]|nr:hypothetical protein YALI2_A00180g [Yarrowia lipolytica]